MTQAGERLQKVLASAGHASRREAEEWIRAGRVSVNGRTARLGDRATLADDIRLDGQPIPVARTTALRTELLVYHKPVGEVTTRRDPSGRPTVFEHLPPLPKGRWIVVGRLDTNTSGLLLFTTDGALAHRLMHPSSEIEREYLVRVRGRPAPDVIARLQAGVVLDDGLARFDRIIETEHTAGHSWFKVVLREGRNREVRRMWNAVGFDVSRLMRIRFGAAELPRDLKPGAWRRAGQDLIDALARAG
jgi:23S rRNA pseudouridine2605 synthase